MRKHVVDTDLYINLIRAGKSLPILDALYEHETPGIYFSSVVAEELLAGAQTKQARRIVRALVGPFERNRRLLTPTHRDWTIAGSVLARLLTKDPSLRSKAPALSNDCLLAVSARTVGASVYTRNRQDFRRIQSVFPFSVVFIQPG